MIHYFKRTLLCLIPVSLAVILIFDMKALSQQENSVSGKEEVYILSILNELIKIRVKDGIAVTHDKGENQWFAVYDKKTGHPLVFLHPTRLSKMDAIRNQQNYITRMMKRPGGKELKKEQKNLGGLRSTVFFTRKSYKNGRKSPWRPSEVFTSCGYRVLLRTNHIDRQRFKIIQIAADLNRIALKRGLDKWAGHEEYPKYFEEDIAEGSDADLNKQMEGLFR